MKLYVKKISISTLLALCILFLLVACDAPKSHKNIIAPENKDFTPEKLPMTEFRGIPFTMSKEDLIKKFGCTKYELTVGCPFYDGEKEEMLWVIFNEAGRIVLMKRDLGYFNYEANQKLLSRLAKKYTVAYEPSPATLNAYQIGLRDSLSFVFADGQVVFQVGRSYNKRNELVNLFIFPADVGATFLEKVQR